MADPKPATLTNTVKGPTWYFLKRVPQHLQEEIGLRRIKVSLGTTDYAKAYQEWKRVSASWEDRFAAIENRQTRQVEPEDEWYVDLLTFCVEYQSRHAGTLPEWGPNRDKIAQDLRDWIVRTKRITLDIPITDQSFETAYRLVRVGTSMGIDIVRNLKGIATPFAQEARETPPAAILEKPKQHSIQDARDKWIEERKPTQASISGADRCIDLFIAINGNLSVQAVGPDQVMAYRDKVAAMPNLMNKTRNRWLKEIGAVFGVAHALRWIAVNPFENLLQFDTDGEDSEKRGFSLEELKAIFGQEFFKVREGKHWDALYWTHVLGLYTGARANELCSLKREHVFKKDGVWVIAIRQGKTAASHRDVPVHDQLVRLGFIKYVERQEDWLFPTLTEDKNGYRSTLIAGASNGIIDQIVTDPNVSWYSYRHSLKTALRSASVEEQMSDYLSGHLNRSIARQYGEYRADRLKAEIDKVQYPIVIPKWK